MLPKEYLLGKPCHIALETDVSDIPWPPGIVRFEVEGLPSSRPNFLHMPFPIHRRVLPRCTSKGFTRSMAFAHISETRLSLVLKKRFFLTMRQDSLHGIACRFARTSVEVTLSRGFNLRISPPVARQLRADLALTSTGLSPVSCV